MSKLEEAAKAYQEKEQGLWTGKGMAKEFQAAFIAGAEWQKTQKSDMQKLWEQSIQLDGLHTFDDAQVACPPGSRVPTGEEWEWLLAHTDFSFDEEKKEGVFRFADGFELRLPAAGYRSYYDGSSNLQGTWGIYWSSSVNGIYARSVYFDSGTVDADYDYRVGGFSVRCVPIEIK